MTCVIGIDPGLSGGVAIYDVATKQLVEVRPIPVIVEQHGRYKSSRIDRYALASQLAEAIEAHEVSLVLIEQVQSSPQMGVASSFKFGQGFGEVCMAAEIYAPRVEFVSPQRWKARMLLNSDKKNSLAAARKLWGKEPWFPKEKHEGLAEAALIALYASTNYELTETIMHPHYAEEDDPLS